MEKYTKSELLNAFCDSFDYGVDPITGESISEDSTKVEFLAEKQLEWAKRKAVRYLENKAKTEAGQSVLAKADGVNL